MDVLFVLLTRKSAMKIWKQIILWSRIAKKNGSWFKTANESSFSKSRLVGGVERAQ
jgi:hypothetical protein